MTARYFPRAGDLVAFDVDGTEWQGKVISGPGPSHDWIDRDCYRIDADGEIFEARVVRLVRKASK